MRLTTQNLISIKESLRQLYKVEEDKYKKRIAIILHDVLKLDYSYNQQQLDVINEIYKFLHTKSNICKFDLLISEKALRKNGLNWFTFGL